MRCLNCGENIDGLEETCRKEFNLAQGEYFDNLETERRKRAFWFGLLVGVQIELVMCFIVWLSGWSWNTFLERSIGRNITLVFIPFLLPLVMGMGFSMMVHFNIEEQEEDAYRRFRDRWSCQS